MYKTTVTKIKIKNQRTKNRPTSSVHLLKSEIKFSFYFQLFYITLNRKKKPKTLVLHTLFPIKMFYIHHRD